jgi:hypothetical protein
MTKGIAISSLVGVFIVVLGAFLYLGRSAHLRRPSKGSAGNHFSPGDPSSRGQGD